ncbi:MAG: hypothetical protein AB7D51_12955 [Desulfovibrionaceae bacterium]
MYCSRCGGELPLGALFCPACGGGVAGGPATARPSPRALRWPWFLGAVLLLPVLVVFLLLQDSHRVGSAMEEHMQALRAGDVAGAYEQTAQLFKDSVSPEQFREVVDSLEPLRQLTDYELESTLSQSGAGEAVVAVRGASGEVLRLAYVFYVEDGEPRIVHFRVE